MPRLGSVVGSILAELVRARLAADELTRELVAEYQADPVLTSMSVPRLVVSEATLTLRFGVSDLEEVPTPPTPDPGTLRDVWVRHAESVVVPRLLDRVGVPSSERSSVLAAIKEAAGTLAGAPTVAEVRRAVGGDDAGTVTATGGPLVNAWGRLPAEFRSRIGTKTALRKELEQHITQEFRLFRDRQRELTFVQAALASNIQVAVVTDQLPEDPGLVQEFRITVQGQDLEVLVSGLGESG